MVYLLLTDNKIILLRKDGLISKERRHKIIFMMTKSDETH